MYITVLTWVILILASNVFTCRLAGRWSITFHIIACELCDLCMYACKHLIFSLRVSECPVCGACIPPCALSCVSSHSWYSTREVNHMIITWSYNTLKRLWDSQFYLQSVHIDVDAIICFPRVICHSLNENLVEWKWWIQESKLVSWFGGEDREKEWLKVLCKRGKD